MGYKGSKQGVADGILTARHSPELCLNGGGGGVSSTLNPKP